MAEEDTKPPVVDEADASTDVETEAAAAEEEGASGIEDKEPSEIDKLKEEIAVAVEDVGTLRKKLTITVARDAIDRRLSKQYDELSNDATVPGFRRGRAPRRLIEKRFGHEVGDQICTQLVGQAYLAATEKENLKPLGDPAVWVKPKPKRGEVGEPAEKMVSVQEALDLIELPAEGALTFACEVEIRPEFNLPDLKNIALEKPRISVTDADVTDHIDRLRASRGNWEPVAEGPIEANDQVVVDLKMTVDGETIKEEENDQVAARPQVVEGVTLEKLGTTLVGRTLGDEVTVEGTVPDDDEREALRGKPAVFHLKVQDIKRLSLPPLDDRFLGSLGAESEDDLRGFVRQDLEARLDDALREGLRGQAQRYLLNRTQLELPSQLSRRQTERAVLRRMLDLRAQGVPQDAIEAHLDALRTSASEQVADELKLQFILGAIAEERDIDVSEEELNTHIAAIARQYNRRFDRVRDELTKGDGLTELYIRIRDNKILDQLVADATITEIEGPGGGDSADGPAKKTKAKKTKKKTKKSRTETDEYADET